MEVHKQSRAAVMAATYADILIKVGVLKPEQRNSTQTLHQQIVRGEVNWWEVCIDQISKSKK
jgi:hypothetical protein